jgi:hypothetical protein
MRLDLERGGVDVRECKVGVREICSLDMIGPNAVARAIAGVPRLVVGNVPTTSCGSAAFSAFRSWNDLAAAVALLTWCIMAFLVLVSAMR